MTQVLIYTHPNLYQVINIQNVLNLKNIKTVVRNEFAAGGSGELSPNDVWPELRLEDERDETIAKSLIEKSVIEETEVWLCGECGEKNDGSFEVCWQCQSETRG